MLSLFVNDGVDATENQKKYVIFMLLFTNFGVSASVGLPLHHKVQKFYSGASSPRWSRKRGRKMVVCV